MKIGAWFKSIKDQITPYEFTDDALIDKRVVDNIKKSMPAVYYQQALGIHNYSFTDPGFSIVDQGNDLLRSSLTYGGHATSNFIELFHCIPEIFAPIHAYAARIANADFQLRKYRNDQVVYDNENWNRLFNTPNPLQHFRELIYEAIVYEFVTGNELMYFNTPSALNTPGRDYTSVSTIWNLPSDQIDIIPKKPLKLYSATTMEDIVETYKLDENNKFSPKDVLHIRSTTLKWENGKIKGLSPLLSADKAIQNLIAVYEARNVIYTKRGALGAIVSRKSDESGLQPLTPNEKKNLREDIQVNYGVTGGRSPIAVTNLPVDFIRFGMSIAELQPFEETLADAAAIYGALGVPFELAPKLKGETFSNQENAERSFYQNAVIPKANMYMQSLTNKLGLNEAKLYLHASFDHVDVLQENKKEKADVDRTNTDTYRERFLHGIATLNDWIVSTGNEKISNPLYEKRVFEMTPEELATVKAVLTMKAPEINNQDGENNNSNAGAGGTAGGTQGPKA